MPGTDPLCNTALSSETAVKSLSNSCFAAVVKLVFPKSKTVKKLFILGKLNYMP